jgi:hypothetical protein
MAKRQIVKARRLQTSAGEKNIKINFSRDCADRTFYRRGNVMAHQEIADQVDRVRSIAKPVLARFSKSDVQGCTESYLFAADRFCGVRLRLGAFEAVWRLGASHVEITRNGHVLQTLALNYAIEQKSAA